MEKRRAIAEIDRIIERECEPKDWFDHDGFTAERIVNWFIDNGWTPS